MTLCVLLCVWCRKRSGCNRVWSFKGKISRLGQLMWNSFNFQHIEEFHSLFFNSIRLYEGGSHSFTEVFFVRTFLYCVPNTTFAPINKFFYLSTHSIWWWEKKQLVHCTIFIHQFQSIHSFLISFYVILKPTSVYVFTNIFPHFMYYYTLLCSTNRQTHTPDVWL